MYRMFVLLPLDTLSDTSVGLGVMCGMHGTLFDMCDEDLGGFKRARLVSRHGRVAEV